MAVPAPAADNGEWSTPDDFWKPLDDVYHFTLDIAATPENAKCGVFFTKQDNGLLAAVQPGNVVWCNPPYGRGDAGPAKWVEKARADAKTGSTWVMLLPVKKDTQWWNYLERGNGWPPGTVVETKHSDLVLGGYRFRVAQWTDPVDGLDVTIAEVVGRLNFGGRDGPGRFASAVVVFEPPGGMP